MSSTTATSSPSSDALDGAARPALPAHDDEAEQPEYPARQARPQPDPMIMATQPAVERQQRDEADEPQGGADRDDAGGVDLHRGRLYQRATPSHDAQRTSRPSPPTFDELLADLRRLPCRVVRDRLGPGPSPEQLVLRLRSEPGLVCLRGAWAGGGAVVTSRPLLVLPESADARTALDALPYVDDADVDVIGGGWFGVLGYDGRNRLAFHDHLLRLVDGVWWFESLRSDSRAAALDERSRVLAEVVASLSDVERPQARVGRFGGPAPAAHLAAVERAVEHIRAGDIYQVNVCTRLSAPFAGAPVDL
ncbi:MAG: para-aminobenzoate synthetase / 4-amino-4-deoxychorismate lyase, partial [Pseudonocardiales bacterium]|nr:para-aminobenzoate synthetase / 4-amino-4-deoxychorismate lyase [Pseudonocardiales bacterium]